ncbi:MAG: hypothetical protein ACYSOZ_04815 [Planctomycetota bacterium]
MKYRILCLGMVFLVFSIGARAAEFGRRGRENGRSEVDARKQQMEQEAQAMASVVQKALTDLLEPVPKNQRPSQDLIQKSQLVLENTKRYFPGFEDKPKAQFMLLQAWTAFYQGDSEQALNWSIRACRTDEASQDTWISQAAFGLLNGRPPAIPRIKKPRPEPKPERAMARRPRRNETVVRAKPQPYSEKGILEFDLLGLNIRMFREQFEKMEFQTTAGEKIAYTPGTDTLCMLFWEDIPVMPAGTEHSQQQPANGVQDEVQKAIQEAMQQAVPEMAEGMSMDSGDVYGNSQKTGIQSQRHYFEVLMNACKDVPEIKFLQINTFKPSLPEAVNVLPDDSQGPIPTVIAAAPQSNAQQFAGLPMAKPFMVIVDKEGGVRYAGTAADFVPAFILTELTGVEIDLAKQSQTEVDPEEMMDPMMMEMPGRRAVDPNRPASDPNNPVADPNAPVKTERPAKPRGEFEDFPTQSIEEGIRADKLLQSAQMHIEESRKLRMKNPRQGIEDARKVLSQFPNTEYAERARELLRRVPDRWKKRHHITDEELGY